MSIRQGAGGSPYKLLIVIFGVCGWFFYETDVYVEQLETQIYLISTLVFILIYAYYNVFNKTTKQG